MDIEGDLCYDLGMKFLSIAQRKALGLSPKESMLLETLHAHGGLNTSALAYHASLPRVTVMRILKGLQERGLVHRKEVPRAIMWSVITQEELQERQKELFVSLGERGLDNIELSEVGTVTIYRGPEKMLESNRKLLEANTGERVLSIEPNGIWKHFSSASAKDWKELNELVKKKQIIVESILEEGFEKVLKKEIDPGVEATFLDLLYDVRIVPERMLDSSTEIFIFRDQVLFMDWAHMVAVEIKNPSTTRVIKAMFRMLQQSGRVYKKS